jgi:hypothetical protein
LDRVSFVMYLEDLGPTGRWAAGRLERWRLERWRLERFAEMEQDLPDRGRVGDERDEPDVATAGRAREREVFSDPREELGPSDSGGVVGTGRCIGGSLTPARSRSKRVESCSALDRLLDRQFTPGSRTTRLTRPPAPTSDLE